jgi:hypothetical protein
LVLVQLPGVFVLRHTTEPGHLLRIRYDIATDIESVSLVALQKFKVKEPVGRPKWRIAKIIQKRADALKGITNKCNHALGLMWECWMCTV